MAVGSLASVGTQTQTTASSGSMSKLAQNFDQFLVLLTAQLQHQDPLSPMETNEFTQQLVSFAGVEQAINTNKNLEELVTVQKSTQALGLLNFMGNTVEAKSNSVPLVDAKATFAYDLEKAASAVTYQIKDASGKVVYTGTGDKTMGRHEYTWDGKSTGGTQLPDGAYAVTIAATDADGNLVNFTQTMVGKVSSVQITDDGAVLKIGAVQTTVDQLTQIISKS
jgi:flagellar basal-body rod modification protein FlgD